MKRPLFPGFFSARALALLLALALLWPLSAPASGFFWNKKADGPKMEDFSKNGLIGSVIVFEPEDFVVQSGSQAVLDSITILSLPDSGSGVLTMGVQPLEEGATVERSALGGLRFQSAQAPTETTVNFTFSPTFSGSGPSDQDPVTVTLYLLTQANRAPEARNMDLSTYKNVAITGYFVSIPVFCDSAFVLLSPIARRLSKDTKISMTTMAISLAMGLHATHMFVPPTPGPLAVAGILNADLGMVILFGALVSIPVMLVGYFASLTAGKKYYYIPEDDSDVTEEEDENAKLPSALASFMPILVPILLMLLKTVGDMVASENILLSILNVIGTPAVALLIGMLLAAYTYHNIHPEDKLAWSFDGLVADSLRTAGQIVLIVGAGGAFGGVLKASAMQSVLTNAFSGLTIGILAPFLIGFIFRTCVGSATIAMVTAATMITPLIDVLGFSSPMGRVIAMLACAAGGMMVFHGNDDFFWVTTTTSKMDTSVAYKTIPIISVLQSLTALVVVFVLSLIFLH